MKDSADKVTYFGSIFSSWGWASRASGNGNACSSVKWRRSVSSTPPLPSSLRIRSYDFCIEFLLLSPPVFCYFFINVMTSALWCRTCVRRVCESAVLQNFLLFCIGSKRRRYQVQSITRLFLCSLVVFYSNFAFEEYVCVCVCIAFFQFEGMKFSLSYYNATLLTEKQV